MISELSWVSASTSYWTPTAPIHRRVNPFSKVIFAGTTRTFAEVALLKVQAELIARLFMAPSPRISSVDRRGHLRCAWARSLRP